MNNFKNRLLTVPFFIILFVMPLGLLILLGNFFPPSIGDWCFKQWEKKVVDEDAIDFLDEQEH